VEVSGGGKGTSGKKRDRGKGKKGTSPESTGRRGRTRGIGDKRGRPGTTKKKKRGSKKRGAEHQAAFKRGGDPSMVKLSFGVRKRDGAGPFGNVLKADLLREISVKKGLR